MRLPFLFSSALVILSLMSCLSQKRTFEKHLPPQTKNNLYHVLSSKQFQKLPLLHVTPQTQLRRKQWHYLLGTPDTSRSGRNTRKARSALTSNPAPFPPIEFPPSALVACSKIALKSLQKERGNNL